MFGRKTASVVDTPNRGLQCARCERSEDVAKMFSQVLTFGEVNGKPYCRFYDDKPMPCYEMALEGKTWNTSTGTNKPPLLDKVEVGEVNGRRYIVSELGEKVFCDKVTAVAHGSNCFYMPTIELRTPGGAVTVWTGWRFFEGCDNDAWVASIAHAERLFLEAVSGVSS